MTKLENVEGIGPKFAEKLKKAGVRGTSDLLNKGATAKGRKALAEASGIAEGNILEWVNHADLFRLKGVGEEYADLLEEAGVDSVPELARRNAKNLHAKMLEVDAEKNLVRRPPSLKMVEDWIAQAKTLPRVVTH